MSNKEIAERALNKMRCQFCKSTGAHIENREVEAYPFCGKRAVFESKVMVCNNCNEQLYFAPLDDASYLKSIYLVKGRVDKLFPQEIRDIRVQLKLSQKSFNKLMDWPNGTIERYEKTCIIPCEHLELLKSLQNPDFAKDFFDKHKSRLPDKRCENCVFWKWYGDNCMCNDTYDDYADYEEYDSEGECYGWIKEE